MLHAELVLLVHDDQAQLMELDRGLEQRMRADGKLGIALRDALGSRSLVLLLQAAGQPHRFDAERCQPVAQFEVMLLGEDLGRCHEGSLVAVLDGLQCGKCGDHSLAAADVALQQALHGMRTGNVVADLVPDFLLCAGKDERQVLQQCIGELVVCREFGCHAPAAFAVVHAHRKLLCQQFVELDAHPGRVGSCKQGILIDVGRGLVQQLYAGTKFRQAQALQYLLRQCVVEFQLVQCGVDIFGKRRLRQSGGGRVDGRECLLQRRGFARAAALGMHHFVAEEAHARFAQGADFFADGELFLLAGIEVEEAQIQDAAVILQLAHQAAARTVHHFAVDDLAFYLCRNTGREIGNARDLCLVFIA